uniref:Putative secreted protein n=1 Tax=Ixodes ricinus TaxID=34613 RepID=A0A6B0UGF2_IXORI
MGAMSGYLPHFRTKTVFVCSLWGPCLATCHTLEQKLWLPLSVAFGGQLEARSLSLDVGTVFSEDVEGFVANFGDGVKLQDFRVDVAELGRSRMEFPFCKNTWGR